MRLKGDVRAAGAIAAGLMLMLAACGDDGEDDTAETDTTEESSEGEPDGTDPEETEEELSPEDEVLAAYEAAWDAVVAAYDPPDPEHPDLLATFGGDALLRHQVALENYQLDGLSEVATSSENDPQVASLVDDTAVVEDCIKEVTEMLDTETREPQKEPQEVTVHSRRHMERTEGTWKIVQVETLGESC